MQALTYLLGTGPTASPLGVRISLFFGALFLAYGVVVPYFPVWLDARGLDPLQISTVTALPLFVRLLVTPSIGLLADRLGNYRLVIVTLAWGALALIARPEPRVRLRADPRHRRRLPACQRHHAAADRDGGGWRGTHAGPRLRPHAAVGVDHLHHRQLRRRHRYRGAGRRLCPVADRLRRGIDHCRRACFATAAGHRAGYGCRAGRLARLLAGAPAAIAPVHPVSHRHRLHARGARDVLHLRRAALAGAGPAGGVGRYAVGDRRLRRGGAVRAVGAGGAPLRAGAS